MFKSILEWFSLLKQIKEAKARLDRLHEQQRHIAEIHVRMAEDLNNMVGEWYKEHSETIQYAEYYRYLREDPSLELAVRKKNATPGDGRSEYIYLDGYNLDHAVQRKIDELNKLHGKKAVFDPGDGSSGLPDIYSDHSSSASWDGVHS